MNPALSGIFSRRSIRKFAAGPVPDATIADVLEAAMAAPSAVAKDPWHFIVVRDPARLGQIADGLPHGQMLRQAAAGLVVCGDLDAAHDRLLSYLLQDCSAAIENALLAASMLGLGACWLGVHPREDRIAHLRKLFALPESIVPVAVLAMGPPAQKAEPRTRYSERAVHRERW
jgi:nitroreductase